MECRCANLDVLWGEEAEAYAADHLRADPRGELVCPDTGARWSVGEPADEPELDQTALRKVAG